MSFMAKVTNQNVTLDLNDINHGYPIYFDTLKQAKDSIQELNVRGQLNQFSHAFVIKLKDNIGHYVTLHSTKL